MKKLLVFVATALLAATTVTTASAQSQGDMSVGLKENIYTHVGTHSAILGIGASFRYTLIDHLRIEPSLVGLCHENCSIDANVNIQYLFQLGSNFQLYPLVGVGVNDFGDWSCGINLGGGMDYSLADHWDLTAGLNWMCQTHKDFKNPVVVQLGVMYRF